MKEGLINQDALIEFKKQVHEPMLKKKLDEIEVKEGYTVIDSMHIAYLDGRNSGHDSRIYVSGFKFENGLSVKYRHEEYDISVKEFMEGIKGIPFIFDGKLTIEDENLSINLETMFCSSDNVAPLFPEVMDIQPEYRPIQNVEYEYLVYFYTRDRMQQQEENKEMNIGGMQM